MTGGGRWGFFIYEMRFNNKNKHRLYECLGRLCVRINQTRDFVLIFWLSGPERGNRHRVLKERFGAEFKRLKPERDKGRLIELMNIAEGERRLKKIRYEPKGKHSQDS